MGTDTHVALIRGINVGHARRVSMANLRALVEDLGYGHVRTLLSAAELAGAVADNSLLEVADDLSRLTVAVLPNPPIGCGWSHCWPATSRPRLTLIGSKPIVVWSPCPFRRGDHRRIAVKIVDDRGIESMKVLEVER